MLPLLIPINVFLYNLKRFFNFINPKILKNILSQKTYVKDTFLINIKFMKKNLSLIQKFKILR